MPTLNWIGRKAVEDHHKQVPFHLLKEAPELSVGDPGSGNLLIEGNNPLRPKITPPIVHNFLISIDNKVIIRFGGV